ncbi:MAG TPA: DUF2726 domain-containing protein [Candidatus Paceibacterota bacterium]
MTEILIGLIAILVLLKLLEHTKRDVTSKPELKRVYNYLRKPYLMTRAESACYKALVEAVGDQYYVFAQVHLPTIVNERIRGQNWRASRAHINRKSVDFVLCDKIDISPKLAIELDDWSHGRPDRQERDREVERILEQSDLPLLRVTNLENLAQRIAEKIFSQAQ